MEIGDCVYTSYLSILQLHPCQNELAECLPGYIVIYNEINQRKQCLECRPGTFSSSVDSKQCERCPPNAYSSYHANQCLACPAGTYSSSDATSCQCLAGHARSRLSWNSPCIPCHGGTYPSKWYRRCVKCPENTYSTALSDSCTPCRNGSYSKPGSFSCSCKPNYMQLGAGIRAECDACPVGTNSNGNGDICKCPAGYKQLGVGGKTRCEHCPSGKYAAAGDAYCASSCKGNTYPIYAKNQRRSIEPGLWTGICEPCPLNSHAVFSSALNRSTCICNDGYVERRSFGQLQLSCVPANSTSEIWQKISDQRVLISILVIAVATLVFWWGWRTGKRSKNTDVLDSDLLTSTDYKGLLDTSVVANSSEMIASDDKRGEYPKYLSSLYSSGVLSDCAGSDEFFNNHSVNAGKASLSPEEAFTLSALFDPDLSTPIPSLSGQRSNQTAPSLLASLNRLLVQDRTCREFSRSQRALSIALAGLSKLPPITGTVYRVCRRPPASVLEENYSTGFRVHWGVFAVCYRDLSTAHSIARKRFDSIDQCVIFRLVVNDARALDEAFVTKHDTANCCVLSPNLVFLVSHEMEVGISDAFSYITMCQAKTHA